MSIVEHAAPEIVDTRVLPSGFAVSRDFDNVP